MCHLWFYHILSSSVIYYWTDARQHVICLFYRNTVLYKSARVFALGYFLKTNGWQLRIMVRHPCVKTKYFISKVNLSHTKPLVIMQVEKSAFEAIFLIKTIVGWDNECHIVASRNWLDISIRLSHFLSRFQPRNISRILKICFQRGRDISCWYFM